MQIARDKTRLTSTRYAGRRAASQTKNSKRVSKLFRINANYALFLYANLIRL